MCMNIKPFLLAIVLAIPNPVKAADCAQWLAKVESIQGKVHRQQLDHNDWQAVKPNDTLCPGDKIRTLKWSRVTLTLDNQSLVTLDQNSTVSFAAPKSDGQFLKLLEGITFFRSHQPQKLQIETPFINAVHEGTEFLVSVDSQQTQITVLDGQVAAQNQAGKIQISKGFTGIATGNQAPRLQALTITPTDAVQWALYYPPIIDDTKNADNHLDAALSAYQQGDINKALSLLKDTPTTQQHSYYVTLAALLLSAGRVDEAIPIIQQIQAKEPNNSEAFALQAIIAVAKNHQQQALELANKAVKANPQSAVAKIAQSYAYQALFNIDDALKATLEATRLNSNNALAWARLAELQLSQGDHNAALTSAKTAQNLNPKIARTQTVLGFADLAETDISAAKQAFNQALLLDSADPLARLGLGLAKIRTGDVEAGKAELETAVNLAPNNAITRSYLGKAYYELRNKDYAGTEFKLAKEMDPKDPTPWFYDAILKQTTNRPVEALHDMQKAIELNDNRGVYRSKLLLDKDDAGRQAGLGRIFNGLGFDDVANRQAMKSLAIDLSNYSAHRLLSDSYASKPRAEIARSSEHLQSQLLQPLNYNPLQPSLAYTDLNIIKGIGPNDTSFNEYTRLFQRNGIRFTTTGIAGSNTTLGDETALSGILNKFSFSLGQLHYQTDGFRKNNDLKHNIYNAFAQYEISPAVNIQGEYRHRETDHGDLTFQGKYDNNNENYRRKLGQDSYRLGLKYSPALHSNLLLSFIYTNRQELVLPSKTMTTDGDNKGYNLEAQYLYHGEHFNAQVGGAIYSTDVSKKTTSSSKPNCHGCGISQSSPTQYAGYVYSNAKLFDQLTLTTGLTYDNYNDNESGNETYLSELNPKLGLIWQVNDFVSLRAAGFKTVKPPIVVNQILQPTQIAGFNQFFDDVNGTVSWQYGVGADAHFHKNIYFGIEAFKRDLKTPLFGGFDKKREELYRLYLNWVLHRNWVINTEYRFENYRPDTGSVQTSYLPLSVRYFNPSGIFAEFKSTWINQKAKLDEGDKVDNSFILVDTAIGYRFPKSYGLISFEIKNLLDKQFDYRDRQFQMNEQRTPEFVPERTFFTRITINY